VRASGALLAAALAIAPLTAGAQGFAGLGTAADGFADPDPAHDIVFPADHGAHDRFRIEWWYLTANLTDASGNAYGVQWTLFRMGLRPPGQDGPGPDAAWMGHAALTSRDRHRVAERMARGGTGQAHVTTAPFAAVIDEWSLAGNPATTLSVHAAGPDFAYQLDLDVTGPPVLQGQRGFSIKSAGGQASHYYSLPFLTASGTLLLDGDQIPVTGAAWIDREWSSQPLAEDQQGWDWFSLRLSGGARLMAFRLRDSDGGAFLSGTWIAPDGRPTPIAPGELSIAPLAPVAPAAGTPTRWQIRLPGHGVDVEIDALNPRARMNLSFPYWEGPVSVSGSHDGNGYLEMTGYE